MHPRHLHLYSHSMCSFVVLLPINLLVTTVFSTLAWWQHSIHTHALMDCCFLLERDKRPWAHSWLLTDHPDIPVAEEAEPPLPCELSLFSPLFWKLSTMSILSNMVCASSFKMYGFPNIPALQMAHQVDGTTPMDMVGKVHWSPTCGQSTFGQKHLAHREVGRCSWNCLSLPCL